MIALRRYTLLLGAVLLVLPFQVHAQIIEKTIGLFNIFVGLMLTVAILTYVAGFIIWACRLGSWPSYRTEAIKIMEWSVSILFVLVALLSIVQFYQNHTDSSRYVGSIVIAVLVVWFVLAAIAKSQNTPAKPGDSSEHA